MMELVQRYYVGERHTALAALGIGLALVLIALALWRTSGVTSLARGMAYVLFIAGTLQATAGLSYAIVTGNRSTAAVRMYSGHTEEDVQQRESNRMRKVLSSSYTGGLVTYTVLLLFGVVLVFASRNAPTWKGVALALMVVGVLGHCVEAFSMQANRRYLANIETWPAGQSAAPRD